MTADVIIKTQIKENVLTIPGTAIKTQDSKNFVQVLVGKKPEQREIKIGLKGSNDVVEIISGLREGEKVIIQQ
jgi:multidrug efflux pump subunit AcrA (membrane-fusion protein)